MNGDSRSRVQAIGQKVAAEVRARRQEACDHNFVARPSKNPLYQPAPFARHFSDRDAKPENEHVCSHCHLTYDHLQWAIFQAGVKWGQRQAAQKR